MEQPLIAILDFPQRMPINRVIRHVLFGSLGGAFLKVMPQLVQAKKVLEIGMFTEYSALCIAEAIPEDGSVTTCGIDEESAALAHRYFARSPHGKKISIHMGPALQAIRERSGPFDLVFIDADKITYVNYYRHAKRSAVA